MPEIQHAQSWVADVLRRFLASNPDPELPAEAKPIVLAIIAGAGLIAHAIDRSTANYEQILSVPFSRRPPDR